MLAISWLIALVCILIVRYGKSMLLYIKRWLRIRELINKLPGPPTIPIFGNSYNLKWDAEEFTFQMEYLFRKYAYNDAGMIRFWLGPIPVIFLSRPSSVKVVLESTTLINKPPEYTLLKPIWGNGLITRQDFAAKKLFSSKIDANFSSEDTWRQRRRLLTPTFHFKILESYLRVFNKQAKVMASILNKFSENGEIVDLLPVLRRFSMDTICETAMGVSINAQKGENNNFYVAITRIFELLFKNLRYPWLWVKPIWYLMGYGNEFDRHVDIVRNLIVKVIDERKREREQMEIEPTFEELTSGTTKKLAFLDLLLSLKNEHKLNDQDLLDEVGTFMIAGYDTVSSSIGFVLWLLGQRPSIQDKVYDELCSIFGDDTERDITINDIKQMTYLEQCMKETIRMYPTVVMFGRRITEDTEIYRMTNKKFLKTETISCGYTIPSGVTVCVSPFAVARDPQQWENPEMFDPDRFLPQNSASRDAFAFLPFSAGPRNCMGQKFATMEEKVALVTILRKFQVIATLCEEQNRALPEVSLKPSRGFPMKLIQRINQTQ